MLNCIIPTMRPNSGMNRPSTPASFMRRSAISGERREVRISMNSRLASGLARSLASMRFSDCVTSRVASGWICRPERSATQNSRIRLTGSRSKASRSATVDAIVVDAEVGRVGDGLRAPAQAAEQPVEPLRGLGLPLLQRRADDRGEIADVLGDQEIVLHEALDGALAGARAIAEPLGDRALQVEAQPLLGAAGEEMQVAAHRPQELLAAAEQLEFARARTGRRRRVRAGRARGRRIWRSRTAC